VDAYGLWSSSYRDRDLWQSCVLYADDSENVEDGDEPMDMTPEQVARDISAHLPLMIATGCAFLDPMPGS